jgi:hypothetical protein
VKYSELDLRDLKLKIERLEPTLSDRLLNYQLSLLKEEGYIEFVEDQSSEYRKCLEAHKTDKRIKSVARYCRERYPTSIKVKILDAGKIRYAHGCFCLNYCLTKNTETAMLNMNLCEKLADIKTRPPSKCLC